MTIGIIGGTGPHGSGLAHRFARAGHDVVLGSRDAARAERAATAVSERLTGPAGRAGTVSGLSNVEAAHRAEIVVVAVPFDGMLDTLRELDLAARLVVSCVNPLAFDAAGPRPLPVAEGSAAERIAHHHPSAVVVAAFHHVSAVTLRDRDDPLDEHVLVAGDDREAKDTVLALAPAVAARGGIDAGPLRSAGALEALTAALIHVNRRYRTHAGVIVTGVPA